MIKIILIFLIIVFISSVITYFLSRWVVLKWEKSILEKKGILPIQYNIMDDTEVWGKISDYMCKEISTQYKYSTKENAKLIDKEIYNKDGLLYKKWHSKIPDTPLAVFTRMGTLLKTLNLDIVLFHNKDRDLVLGAINQTANHLQILRKIEIEKNEDIQKLIAKHQEEIEELNNKYKSLELDYRCKIIHYENRLKTNNENKIKNLEKEINTIREELKRYKLKYESERNENSRLSERLDHLYKTHEVRNVMNSYESIKRFNNPIPNNSTPRDDYLWGGR